MTDQSTTLSLKEADLSRIVADFGPLVVAYSGGVDSTFLAAVAHEVLADDFLAATAVSPSLSHHELTQATALARRSGWNHVLVESNEVTREEYVRNSPDRCYWCKVELFDVLAPLAEERSARVAVGTNKDDLGDFRPGQRAARERSAVAPLVEAGLSKDEIRELSRRRGLPTADKPASACLASRFAYGVRVTAERLERIERAEELMRELGFSIFRVRDHGDLARIEVEPGEIGRAASLREKMDSGLRALGWRYVTLDLTGFRSGSMNEVLSGPRIRTQSKEV
ncbi:MAG: ATP-dependent sacrificial sulfur transferase LarE [Actinomycetota bacterium]|nr:ATP-dependent sacrificial sulfur transferase LarE [Actinomycetota bacterium]